MTAHVPYIAFDALATPSQAACCPCAPMLPPPLPPPLPPIAPCCPQNQYYPLNLNLIINNPRCPQPGPNWGHCSWFNALLNMQWNFANAAWEFYGQLCHLNNGVTVCSTAFARLYCAFPGSGLDFCLSFRDLIVFYPPPGSPPGTPPIVSNCGWSSCGWDGLEECGRCFPCVNFPCPTPPVFLTAGNLTLQCSNPQGCGPCDGGLACADLSGCTQGNPYTVDVMIFQ